jgi:hypothetical protein
LRLLDQQRTKLQQVNGVLGINVSTTLKGLNAEIKRRTAVLAQMRTQQKLLAVQQRMALAQRQAGSMQQVFDILARGRGGARNVLQQRGATSFEAQLSTRLTQFKTPVGRGRRHDPRRERHDRNQLR